MGLQAVATILAKNEIEIEEGMTTIATDGKINIVTTIEEIHGTILIASQNGKIGITIRIVSMIRIMIGNDVKIEMAGREAPMGVIRGVDGLVQQGVGVQGKIDRDVYTLERTAFVNSVNIKLPNRSEERRVGK